MRCASLLLVLAGHAFAAGINTDAALTAGKGQVVARTKLRYASLERDVDSFLAQETVLYGLTAKISLFSTLGYVWNSPGADGLTDLSVRGKFRLIARDEKRATLSFSGILGVEIPIGEQPIGSPDGGLRVGAVGTWEQGGWRIDADIVHSFLLSADDILRVDVALIRNVGETDEVLWQAVFELNYRGRGTDGVLFAAPGLVYEISGWKIEGSVQVAVAEDLAGPAPEVAFVFSVVHVF